MIQNHFKKTEKLQNFWSFWKLHFGAPRSLFLKSRSSKPRKLQNEAASLKKCSFSIWSSQNELPGRPERERPAERGSKRINKHHEK
jgi:hypothetical protein